MEWKPPSKDEILWAKYGVWLESLGDAATILGISHTTLKSQRQREPSDDGCILYKGINIENASIVRSGTYKRTGRQYREQRIVWDSRTVTDIESFLTDQLGELAILKI
jgi:hypothetical protein